MATTLATCLEDVLTCIEPSFDADAEPHLPDGFAACENSIDSWPRGAISAGRSVLDAVGGDDFEQQDGFYERASRIALVL